MTPNKKTGFHRSWSAFTTAITPTDADREWRRRAACLDVEPELFYPGKGEPAAPAKAICSGCPVSAICLETHLGEIEGVFGGTTPQERRRLRRGEPLPEPKPPRVSRFANDVEFALEVDPSTTAQNIADRLGLTRDALFKRLGRAGRRDLSERLIANGVRDRAVAS